ncbi:MAG: oligosaccharide flippase family protein [Bacteroidales bacterium]|nr:oligosaccharide flippase family protein [Bacteroidales bacterium]
MKFQAGKYVNNISSLQIYNLLRFTTFLLVSIALSKFYSPKDIGDFELMMFMVNIASFFWVTGIIQSFLSLYNSNPVFPGIKTDRKSPEIWNAFLLLCLFSLLFVIFGLTLQGNLHVFSEAKKVPYFGLVLIYFLISNPSNLIEYIYILRNKSSLVLLYGFLSHALILAGTLIPVWLGMGIKEAFTGLIIATIPRVIWLVFLLVKYAEPVFSWEFMKTHLHYAWPLIISTLLSGSAQYIDGFIVANKFNAKDFAYFRYGAKEFPLVVMLANGLHAAMIPEFSTTGNISEVLKKIRHKSIRLINALFPLSMVLLLFSNWLFIHLFNPAFRRGSDIFMIYLLLIISRLVFPQTILIGLRKTSVMMWVSVVEIFLNVALSLFLIQFYGLQGVPLATVIIFVLEKIVLIAYNYFHLKIPPQSYIPVKLHLMYSALIIILFVLIDRRIIPTY